MKLRTNDGRDVPAEDFFDRVGEDGYAIECKEFDKPKQRIILTMSRYQPELILPMRLVGLERLDKDKPPSEGLGDTFCSIYEIDPDWWKRK